ncbi:hypothetical protein NM208_g2290 [Fusarium decemcellulare]|uniref:Uncharacterized protein n=1 Tax=Fusarium decemcellulare TaxID=57161 RepID=A0ACC1ST65_9HYPO|nr:hypothetical protein NM208_g2290 [Fusarium decemcellulare]
MSDDDRAPMHETSDEEEEEDENEIYTAKKAQKAAERMEDVFKEKVTEDDVDQFVHDHQEIVFNELPTRDGTFLHKIVQLVNEGRIKPKAIEPLVRKLVEKCPDLLKYTNDEKQTPLYRAVHLKRYSWRLVNYMLTSCKDPLCITDALQKTCGEDRLAKTCLTLAFEKGLNDEVLQRLVSHANDETLGLRDGSGRTLFHYAVQYDQCSNGRVDVIKLLLERDGAIFKRHEATEASSPLQTCLDYKYTRREDNIEYSVYGEHQRTERLYHEEQARIKREAKERELKAREMSQDRVESKAPNMTAPTKGKDVSKGGGDKGPKSRLVEERDRSLKVPDRDHQGAVIDQESQNVEDRERRRQDLKEQEKEAQERKARDKKQPRHQLLERTKHPKDLKDRPDDQTLAVSKGQSDHAPNSGLKRRDTTRNFDVDHERKKKDKKAAPPKKSTAKGLDSKVLATNSKKILDMLKLHYMRTRNVKMSTSFLENNSKGIRLDNVLKYVRFPMVTVRQPGRLAPKPRAQGREDMEFFFGWLEKKGVKRILRVEVEDSDKIPHSDQSIQVSLEQIAVEHLDWQKTDLDPRVICQLGSKTDRSEPDESVTKSCLAVSDNQLREVTLKWSGNNAVLRAWSEVDGLPQLEKLHTIYLNIPAHSDLLDTEEWVTENLEEFKARLNRNANEKTKAKMTADMMLLKDDTPVETKSENGSRVTGPALSERRIEVQELRGKKGTEVSVLGSGTKKSTGRVNLITEHEWLNCMETFAEYMHAFWHKTVEPTCDKLQKDLDNSDQRLKPDNHIKHDFERLKRPVVVALIDDGVDSCDQAFAGRVIEGKTFDYEDGDVGQYYISGKGHGTEMAKMIFKVCPMAKIYSIRLKTHQSQDKDHSTIDPISAALAIEAALEKNVSLISMSWTIAVPAEGSKKRKILDEVLDRACKQKVPMFCSSSDKISASVNYPSAFRKQSFFRIGAAYDDGSPLRQAGLDNDFIFPGVNVDTSGGRSLPLYLADGTPSTKESTGSSIATALAAGLAAMIACCFKASALATVAASMQQGKDYVGRSELVKPGDVDRIVEHEVLKAAFKKIDNEESGQFIQVWGRFGKANKVFADDNNTEEAKMQCIMNLCSNLIERHKVFISVLFLLAHSGRFTGCADVSRRALRMDERWEVISSSWKYKENHLPFQSFHCIPGDLLAHTNGFNPGFFNFLELANLSKMWLGCVTWAKLASPYDSPATLSIITRDNVGTLKTSLKRVTVVIAIRSLLIELRGFYKLGMRLLEGEKAG